MAPWGSYSSGASGGLGNRPMAPRVPTQSASGAKGGIKPVTPTTSTTGTAPQKPFGNRPNGGTAIKPAVVAAKPGMGAKPGPSGAKPPSNPPPGANKPSLGVKRPGGPEGAASGSAAKKPLSAAGGKTPAFTVTTNSKKDEIGIQTLVGTYSEVGSNHGRKYYQKMEAIPGHDDVQVFLYYWDNRDGADFSGWWFGDELGGTQVWARCSTHGPVPPRVGWRIPWDAPKAEPGILIVDPYKKVEAAKAPAIMDSKTSSSSAAKPSTPAKPTTTATTTGLKPTTPAATTANPAAIAARVKKATTQVETAEKNAKLALEKTKSLKADSAANLLKTNLDAVTAQQTKLNEVMKSLTQDITETRKGGPTAVTSVTELSKLSPRIRTTLSQVTAEINKIKGFQAAATKKVEQEKKDAENAEKLKKQEGVHAKEFEAALPAVEESVSAAEDAVEAVHITAQPLTDDPPDEPDEALQQSMEEVEKSAADAQSNLAEARKVVSEKLMKARAYAPEARKKAVAAFSALQDKVAEAQKKLNPYKNFKKEFQQRVEAKKALVDISDKIAAAELEVEKATMMSEAANHGQMSEDEVKSSEELVSPAETGLTDVTKIIDAKMKTSTGFMKDELMLMKTRIGESRKKLEGVTTVLKHQREGLALQQMAGLVTERVDAAEESLQECQEAEMPFLKGIEVLPKEESDKALSDSDKAAAASAKKLESARNFLKSKLAEAKRYSKEASKAVVEELNDLEQRLDEVGNKLEQFKKETSERKMGAVMAEVLEAVTTAERKSKELTEAATIFDCDNVDDLVIDDLKAAGEKIPEIDKQVSTALQEARNLLAAKQKTAKGGDLAQALSKVNTRVNGVQNEVTKAKKAVANGDRLIKGKTALIEEGNKIKEAEASVEKAEGISKPGEGEKLSDENIKEMDLAVNSASKVLKSCQGVATAQMNSALPVLKGPFQKLVDRCKKALSTIDEIKAATKDQRETVMSEVYVQQGKSMADDIAAAMDKVNEAELPFLKGIEVVDLKEATTAIKDSEEAAETVQKLISDVRSFLASKNIEVKGFKSDNAKESLEEFRKLTERVTTEAGKLSQFRKDTEARKKSTQMQEAGEKVATLEADVEKVVEGSKPFASEEPIEEDLTEQWKTLSALEKETKTKVDEAREFLAARKRDARGDEDKTKFVNDLDGRLKTAVSELAKARKVVGAHEQKFKAKALLEEAALKIAEMDDAIKQAAEFCAPVVEEGGERFLISARKQFIADAMKEHMQEKETSLEDFITTMGGSDGKVPKDAFIKYLASLPETLSNEALTLTEERQEAIFEQMDIDKDGSVSVEDFQEATKRTYTCVHGIAVTDGCDIATSKTVSKLEEGDVLEAHGVAKKEKDKPDAVKRLHVKMVNGDKEGWVTMAGNAGTTYLEEIQEITGFVKSCEAKLKETTVAHSKVMNYFASKVKELSSTGKGALLEAKEEVLEKQSEAKSALKSIEDMKKKVAGAKRSYESKVKEEANAHIVAKEKKEADAITEPAKEAIAAMEAELKKLEEVAAPLVSLKSDEVSSFPTPATIQQEAKVLADSTKKLAEDAKTCIKEQQEKLTGATKGPLFDGKKALGSMMGKANKAEGAVKQVQISVQKACAALADSCFQKVQSAMREDVQKKSLSLDDLWAKLSTAGEERITEADFCKQIASLEDITMPEEHAMLVTRKLETGGIGRRAFMSFLQQYMVVVKEIAITNTFEINTKDKPIRRAELDEVFEVLEGPKVDEKIGLSRVRAKSMNDSIEGWISVKGNNQGKVFLSEVEKPFYRCTKEFPLQKEFSSGSEAVRPVKVEEILELIEGPRKEVFQNSLRMRGKTRDGKTGWFTVKDKHGVELATKGTKHYVCTATVAMTDIFDIKTCKVLKKLSVDDVFILIEGPTEDKDAGLVRVKGKLIKDDIEGWVTVQGNAGTKYAKVNEKLYTVEADELLLQNAFASSTATTVRTLAKGEGLEALEGPKEEKFAAATRMKCRTSGDNAVGWLTMVGANISTWSGSYKVAKVGPMHETRTAGEITIRDLEVGEKLDLLEGPVEEAGEMRMKVRAKKDNAMGWVSFKDAEGKKLIESV